MRVKNNVNMKKIIYFKDRNTLFKTEVTRFRKNKVHFRKITDFRRKSEC